MASWIRVENKLNFWQNKPTIADAWWQIAISNRGGKKKTPPKKTQTKNNNPTTTNSSLHRRITQARSWMIKTVWVTQRLSIDSGNRFRLLTRKSHNFWNGRPYTAVPRILSYFRHNVSRFSTEILLTANFAQNHRTPLFFIHLSICYLLFWKADVAGTLN